jgi:hypothetical protein
MSTTKYKLGEICQLYLGGGRTPTGQKVHIKEIQAVIETVINTKMFHSLRSLLSRPSSH